MQNYKNTNLFIYGGIAALILGIGFIIYLLFSNSETPNSAIQNNQAEYPESVKDVIANPIEDNYGVRLLKSDTLYDLTYFSQENIFGIDIKQQPVKENALLAEQGLLELLQVSKEQLCTYAVSIKVINSVDEDYSGYEFKPSFCADGKKIDSITNLDTPAGESSTEEENTIR